MKSPPLWKILWADLASFWGDEKPHSRITTGHYGPIPFWKDVVSSTFTLIVIPIVVPLGIGACCLWLYYRIF